MAQNFLDKTGLARFWRDIKQKFVWGVSFNGTTLQQTKKVVNNSDVTTDSTTDIVGLATASTAGFMTSTQYSKLDGIQAGAQVNRTYTEVTGIPYVDQAPAFGSSFIVGTVGQTTTGAITVQENTVTIPDTYATSTLAGLMPSSYYTKLTGIEAGAQVNRTYTAVTGIPTGNQAPAFGVTFNIGQYSQDENGQVAVTTRTVKIPDTAATSSTTGLMTSATFLVFKSLATNLPQGGFVAGSNITLTYSANTFQTTISAENTDVNVQQNAVTTANNSYPILLAYNTNTGAVTNAVNKASTLTYNPSTKALLTGGTINTYTLAAACAKGVDNSMTTASTSTNLPTTSAVATAISSAITAAQVGAAMFQSVVDANSTISNSNYKKGWYWVVGTPGPYVGITEDLEAGDMIFAIADKGSAYNPSDFKVVQANLKLVPITNTEIDSIVAA